MRAPQTVAPAAVPVPDPVPAAEPGGSDDPVAPTPGPVVPPTTNTLYTSQALHHNQYLTSASGKYTFYMQSDGNAVLYSPYRYLWQTDTPNINGQLIQLQADGNLVLYNTLVSPWQVLWTTATSGSGGNALVMQDDGNLVLYTANWQPVWATNTAGQQ
jgi:hypothetical protein